MAYWEGSSGYAIFMYQSKLNPTPEVYQEVPERKMGVEIKNQAEKPTIWVFEERIKQENP